MALYAFWNAPLNDDTATIRLEKSTSSAFVSSVSTVTDIPAVDYYGEWVTFYYDEAESGVVYYRAQYMDENGVVLDTGTPFVGKEELSVRIEQIFDLVQGLPRNAVNAALCYLYIRYVTADISSQIRQQLLSATATEESYTGKIASRILYRDGLVGQSVQLRHYPIVSIDKVQYRIRSSSTKVDITDQLDMVVEDKDAYSGYNHGTVSFFPKSGSVLVLSNGLSIADVLRSYDFEMLIDYKHGYATVPLDLQQAIAETVAGSFMEIAGESDTAGLSSQSVDGMSESFTASATTTVFSARRIMYTENAKKIISRHNKPFFA